MWSLGPICRIFSVYHSRAGSVPDRKEGKASLGRQRELDKGLKVKIRITARKGLDHSGWSRAYGKVGVGFAVKCWEMHVSMLKGEPHEGSGSLASMCRRKLPQRGKV